MVILTGIDGLEIRELKFIKVDVDLSDTKDFEIQIPASEWSSDLEYKGRVFMAPNMVEESEEKERVHRKMCAP